MSWKGFKHDPTDGGSQQDQQDPQDPNNAQSPQQNTGGSLNRPTGSTASSGGPQSTAQGATATGPQRGPNPGAHVCVPSAIPGPPAPPSAPAAAPVASTTRPATVPIVLPPTVASAPTSSTAPTATAIPTATTVPIIAPVPVTQNVAPFRAPNNITPWTTVGSVSSTNYSPHQLVIQTAVDNREAGAQLHNTLHNKGLKIDVATGGRASTVRTNFLSITQRPTTIFIYRVEFTREYTKSEHKPVLFGKKFDKQGLFEALQQHPNYRRLQQPMGWSTDYSNIWSSVPLFNRLDYTYVPPSVPGLAGINPNSYRPITAVSASIAFDRTIDLHKTVGQLYRDSSGRTNGIDDPALLARGLNSVVSQYARNVAQQTNPTVVQSGANNFYSPSKSFTLNRAGTVVGVPGFFVSVRPGAQQLLFNINLRCSPFLQKNVDLQKLVDSTCTNPKMATSILKGVRVQRTDSDPATLPHRGLEFVAGFGGPENAVMVNVGRDPHKYPGQVDWRSASELRTVDYSSYRQPLSPDQTTRMIREALKRPADHTTSIENQGVKMFGLNDPSFVKFLQDGWGMVIDTKLQSIPCRYLDAPRLWYGSKNPSSVQDAVWDLRNLRLNEAERTTKIMVLDLSYLPDGGIPGRTLKNNFRPALQEALKRLGHRASVDIVGRQRLSTTFRSLSRNPSESELATELQYQVKLGERNVAACILVIPRKTFDLYSTIKRVADLQTGIHVTCVSSESIDTCLNSGFNRQVQHCSNIVLKLNLKGSGANHKIDRSHFRELYQPSNDEASLAKAAADTIVIGADVTHPMGLCAPGCPSVAAVVGSTDDDFAKFPGSMRLQRGRQEIITHLDDMIMERLIDWAEKHGGRLPTSMLFYRDGVSESQFDEVRTTEIRKVQQGYAKADNLLRQRQGVAPNNSLCSFDLTFVVVGKRHNTRFFPGPDKDGIKNGNVRPGLVVDQVITHPYIMDFYLQSHNPLHGTGKSAHYFVLQNRMQISSDRLQEITHAFCYNYARATRGVSYCGPAYYADRLCDRGRAYVCGWLMGRDGHAPSRQPNEGEDPDSYKDFAAGDLHNNPRYRPDQTSQKYGRVRQNPWHPNLDDTMFYL